MFDSDQYQLLDFGLGRRLERFGPFVLDRPAPAVEDRPQANPGVWQQADARFERGEKKTGRWHRRRELPDCWNVCHGAISLEVKPTEFGHLGVFPEQAANWDWIVRQVRRHLSPSGASEDSRADSSGPLKVLNLFAYTGASTLSAAAAGGEVVHVDSARNTVAWARRNAEHSSLVDAPIRWISEDALKFVKREIRRGNRYDAVILDPPSYGHGPRGEVWRLSKHLPQLLARCAELTEGRLRFLLLTCHTPAYDPGRLNTMLGQAMPDVASGELSAEPLSIQAVDGRIMPGGVGVWWSRAPG